MKLTKTIIIVLSLIVFSDTIKADTIDNKTDSLIYESYIREFSLEKDAEINELLIKSALYFLNTPYVASTLEISDSENLVINLREFDCTTFVENCIALTRVVKSGDLSFTNYCKVLSSMRYRGGKIDGYVSRLHYTSEWISENEQNGILKNISLDLNGNSVEKKIDFMSTHSHLYKHLNNDSLNLKKVKGIEKKLYLKNNYRFIPVSEISNIEKEIYDGDIIVFASNTNGLDYSHIGIAYHKDKALHFIHASSSAKKVIIEPKLLKNYCVGSKQCSGISVLRLKEYKK